MLFCFSPLPIEFFLVVLLLMSISEPIARRSTYPYPLMVVMPNLSHPPILSKLLSIHMVPFSALPSQQFLLDISYLEGEWERGGEVRAGQGRANLSRHLTCTQQHSTAQAQAQHKHRNTKLDFALLRFALLCFTLLNLIVS